MPQQDSLQSYVFLDSLQQDTIWLDVNAFPAKLFNPPVVPDLVFFNLDSAIQDLIVNKGVDTSVLNKIHYQDTVFEKSFLHIYTTPGKTGTPETKPQPETQLVMSSAVLLIVFGIFALIFTSSKTRIVRYFSSIFDQRKFKDYFAEEHPRFLPTTPVLYLLQTLIVGNVIGIWLWGQMGLTTAREFIGWSLGATAVYAALPLIRNGLIMLLGNVFMIQQDARKHVFISYLSHSTLCMLTLPLAILMAVQIPEFLPFFNISFYVCLGLTMIYQIVKLIQNTQLPDTGALLYIFLYFCTLEILPLFMMYKMVSVYAYN